MLSAIRLSWMAVWRLPIFQAAASTLRLRR
jgi:hypothetical protein